MNRDNDLWLRCTQCKQPFEQHLGPDAFCPDDSGRKYAGYEEPKHEQDLDDLESERSD